MRGGALIAVLIRPYGARHPDLSDVDQSHDLRPGGGPPWLGFKSQPGRRDGDVRACTCGRAHARSEALGVIAVVRRQWSVSSQQAKTAEATLGQR